MEDNAAELRRVFHRRGRLRLLIRSGAWLLGRRCVRPFVSAKILRVEGPSQCDGSWIVEQGTVPGFLPSLFPRFTSSSARS